MEVHSQKTDALKSAGFTLPRPGAPVTFARADEQDQLRLLLSKARALALDIQYDRLFPPGASPPAFGPEQDFLATSDLGNCYAPGVLRRLLRPLVAAVQPGAVNCCPFRRQFSSPQAALAAITPACPSDPAPPPPAPIHPIPDSP